MIGRSAACYFYTALLWIDSLYLKISLPDVLCCYSRIIVFVPVVLLALVLLVAVVVVAAQLSMDIVCSLVEYK